MVCKVVMCASSFAMLALCVIGVVEGSAHRSDCTDGNCTFKTGSLLQLSGRVAASFKDVSTENGFQMRHNTMHAIRSTQAGPLQWYGASNGWKQTNTFADGAAFCQSKGRALCSKDQYCPGGSVVGGYKSSNEWVPYAGDGENAWLHLSNGPSLCKSHHEMGWGRPPWGTSTEDLHWRSYIGCCAASATTGGSGQVMQDECPGLSAGDRFIQFGEWRFGDVDGLHASLAHKDGKTAQIFRSDGTLHPGPRIDWSTWGRSAGAAAGIQFGDRFIQVGDWRIGAVDSSHASIAHKDGKTAQIFRKDGTVYPGPRTDFSTWSRPVGNPEGIGYGDRFIQIGQFRLGDVDGQHASVAHAAGITEQIYRSDGTLHPGPRIDYTTFGRPEQNCKLQ